MKSIQKFILWSSLLACLLGTFSATAQRSGDCSEKRLRKGYLITARKMVGGVTTTKRYQALTENYLLYLVELDANGRGIKRIDTGGEPLPDGLALRAELRQEMDYVYGSDNRLKLEQKLKMVPLIKFCKPWAVEVH